MADPASDPNARAGRIPPRRGPIGPTRRSGFGCVLVHETNRGAVAWLSGDLDFQAAPRLLSKLIEFLNLPLECLTLDLAEVRFIDRHCVTVLAAARRRAAAREIAFVLDAMPESVSRVVGDTAPPPA